MENMTEIIGELRKNCSQVILLDIFYVFSECRVYWGEIVLNPLYHGAYAPHPVFLPFTQKKTTHT